MIILVGESGSGKTTILNELEKRGFQKAINHTTRAKRSEEDELKEYKFITKEEFETMWKEGKLLQRAEFNGEFYGVSTESLADNVVSIMIVQSILDVKNTIQRLNLKNVKLKLFYIYVPEEERVKRMTKRGDTREEIQKRLMLDREKFKNVKKIVDYTVENEKLEETVQKILKLYQTDEITSN